jgi:hypothetical protein
VQRLEDPQEAVEFVEGRLVLQRPAGADRDGVPSDSGHVATGVAQALHQVLDQVGVVQVNRCHSHRCAPGVAAAGSHFSVWSGSGPGQGLSALVSGLAKWRREEEASSKGTEISLRRRLSWIVLGAVVAVGLIAGLDALRSSGREPPTAAAERERTVTTTTTETAAVLITDRPPVRLRPGRVSTDLHFPPVVEFTVPRGWYGSQDETGFVLGRGLVGGEVAVVLGGITVYVLDSPFAEASSKLAQVKGVQVKSPVRIGGSLGRTYARKLGLHRDVTLEDIGAPGVVPSGRLGQGLILLGAGGKTLVIRRSFTTDLDLVEVNRVLMSFRAPG